MVLVVVMLLIVAMGVMEMVVVGIVVLVVRVPCIGVVGVDCVAVVDILVLDAVYVVEVVERVELVVGCVVRCVARLVLWCVNGRGYFLHCFSLKSVEVKGLSVGGFLFGMVIWPDVLLGVMVVVEVVVVETADAWFFIFFRRGCLGDMMDVSVVMELVVGVVVLVGVMVLVWWRCSIVWQWVWELVMWETEEGVCRVVEEMLVWLMVELMVDELGGGIVAGSLMGFSESSGKTPHIVSHSCSISLVSFRKLACKEEVV